MGIRTDLTNYRQYYRLNNKCFTKLQHFISDKKEAFDIDMWIICTKRVFITHNIPAARNVFQGKKPAYSVQLCNIFRSALTVCLRGTYNNLQHKYVVVFNAYWFGRKKRLCLTHVDVCPMNNSPNFMWGWMIGRCPCILRAGTFFPRKGKTRTVTVYNKLVDYKLCIPFTYLKRISPKYLLH